MNIQLALPNASANPASRTGSGRADATSARLRRRIHVLVVDEEGMIRDAVCALLGSMPQVARVSCAMTGADALRMAASLRPDVVTVEFPKSQEAGVAFIADLKRQRQETRVIVLTFHTDEHLIKAALRAGADGYVLKKDTRDALASAFDSVLAGKTYLSAKISMRVIRGGWRKTDRSNKHKAAASHISIRERQVIRLIALGHPSREIAELLSISHKTVEKHRTSIMRKLGLRNATAVAAYAVAHGFVDD